MDNTNLKDFRDNMTGITLEDFINNTRKSMMILGILEIGDDPELRVKSIKIECEKLTGYRPDDIWYFKHETIDGLFVIVRRVKPGSKMETGLMMCGFRTLD